MMKRFFILSVLFLTVVTGVFAQRKTDALDRGLIAIKTNSGVYCSWRIMGEEYYDVTYNLYRDGTKVASELNVSNYTDAAGTTSSTYTVKAVVRGVEQAASKAAAVWANNYLEIAPKHEGLQAVYVPNDACCADVTGDGQLEILIKFDNQSEIEQSYPKNGPNINGVDTKEYSLFECLKLDGTRLWWVNCGPNMGDFQNNEQNIVAYDWDGDGKAEAIFRAADGTTIHDAFGQTHVIGDASKNYRAATGGGTNWFMHDGAEYLVYINGETGVPYQIMEYPLKRLEDGETNLEKAWGDGYGHRSSKHFFGAPYLDGRKPSIFLARGIYTRHKMIAYDVDPATHELTERWRWYNNTAGSPWYGQGYHNYTIADVDWDGRDEIVFGSMVIDDNGKGLSTTGFGHGDAHHVNDFNPYVHGSEIFACMEDNPGTNYRDATTSKIYYRYIAPKDVGRCLAGNFSNDFPGAMGKPTDIGPISLVTANTVSGITATGITENFRIYWDGDLCEESFDGAGTRNATGSIYKYGNSSPIASLTGSITNNDTKNTPCYQGDLFGDWREEVMMRTADNKIRIYSTTIPTEHRNYTLWHDMQYRNAMVWQMCGYNQPPHASYFLGELEGITAAPPALTNTNRTEIENGGSIGTSLNDQQVMLAATSNATVAVVSGASPYIFFDNAPSWVQGNDDNDDITYEYFTHTLTGEAFTGAMRLVKQGDGALELPNVTETYTGNTDIWAGTLRFNGTMQNSPLWLNRHTNLESAGTFNAGITADYNATIYPGGKNTIGNLTATILNLGFGSRIVFDTNAEGTTDQVTATTLKIEKKDWENGPEYSTPVFQIVDNGLVPGSYILANVSELTGNISDIKVEGIIGKKFTLTYENSKIILTIIKLRDPAEVVWNGATDGIWDFAETENFSANGVNSTFVTGDAVTFNDEANSTDINLTEDVYPSSVIFNNSSKNFTLAGNGNINGATSLTKQGDGSLTINNINKFTGGTKIEGGKLTVVSLADKEGADYGALGGTSEKITLNGGTLVVPVNGKTSQTIGLGSNGGSIEVKSGTFTLNGTTERNGANITGELHKTGSGTMTLGTTNKFGKLYVDAGKVNVRIINSRLSAAETIVFNGQNVSVTDENNTYDMSGVKNTTNFEVTEGASGSLYLDGRCEYTGKLTGTGTLTVYATYVRNYLKGNWSNFEGTLVANHSGDSYEFSWSNSYGLPKATLNIASGTTFTNSQSSLTLGALNGSGTLAMTGNLTVGKANKDMNFSGTFIGSVNVFKEGTGTWTVKSAVNANEYTFREGDVVLNNTKGTTSLFGSAIATVQGTAFLKGVGTVGNIRVIEGGTVEPGTLSSTRHYGAITSTGFMYFYPTSKLNLNVYKVLTNNNGRSYIVVKGKLEIKGEISIGMGEEYVPQVGDSFIMWTCGTLDAAPTAINLPELPEGMEWDTTDLLTTTGTLRVKAATGIKSIRANDNNNGKIYTLDGKTIENPTKKGIYIQNGKKVVIK